MFERLVHLQMPFTVLNMQRRMIPSLREVLDPFYPQPQDHPIVTKPDLRTPVPGMAAALPILGAIGISNVCVFVRWRIPSRWHIHRRRPSWSKMLALLPLTHAVPIVEDLSITPKSNFTTTTSSIIDADSPIDRIRRFTSLCTQQPYAGARVATPS